MAPTSLTPKGGVVSKLSSSQSSNYIIKGCNTKEFSNASVVKAKSNKSLTKSYIIDDKLTNADPEDTKSKSKLESIRVKPLCNEGGGKVIRKQSGGYKQYLNKIKLAAEINNKFHEIQVKENENLKNDGYENIIGLIYAEIAKKKEPNKTSQIYKRLEQNKRSKLSLFINNYFYFII